jgi:hypothetical protein
LSSCTTRSFSRRRMWKYSSTIFTSALDGIEWAASRSGSFTHSTRGW